MSIETARDGHVAIFTVDRPPHNFADLALIEGIGEAFAAADADAGCARHRPARGGPGVPARAPTSPTPTRSSRVWKRPAGATPSTSPPPSCSR